MSCQGVGGGTGGVVNPVTPVIALGIFKVHNGTFAAGSNATYTITVRNNGTIATTAPITVTDSLPTGLTFVSGAGAGWTCSATNGNQNVTCTNAGPLAAGATSANMTLTVSIAASALGGISNTATVDTSGNNSANNSSTDVAVLNGCLGSASGNELVLRGQYAILAQGFRAGQPVAMAASFTADGQGHITAGEEDLNNSAPPQHLTINSGSLYTVGSDNRACIQLAYSGGTTIAATFRLALGGVSAGIASKARIIEFDDNSGTGVGTRVSGILRLQDPTAFSPTQLKTNYALGADGVDFVGDHFALAGSINVASGSILYDLDGGALGVGASCTGAGQITSLSGATGRGLLTLTPALTTGCTSLPPHEALYVVNANQFFFIQIDQLAIGHNIGSASAIMGGRAIATGNGSFSSNSLSGNYILHLTGGPAGSSIASVNLGLLKFSPGPGNTGTVTGTLFGYSQSGGAVTTPIAGASYTVDPASGRVTLSGLGFTGSLGLPPVVYVTTPTDGISAFFAGTDIDGTFGLMEFQPTQIYSPAAVAGTYILGTEDPGLTDDQSGVATLSSAGAVSGILDQSGLSGLQANQAILGIGSVSISPDGTGNVGPKTAAITDGTKLFFIDESGGPAVIKVLEK